MLYGVPWYDIEIAWPQVEGFLQKAVDQSPGDRSVLDYKKEIEDAKAQLWVWIVDGNIRAACVTRIVEYPNRKVCAMPLIGGDSMKDWLLVEPQLIEWAKEQGCSQLEGYCRDGWLRVLKNWRKVWTTMRRDI